MAVAAFPVVAVPIYASARLGSGSATIVDAVGDAGGAPDISAVTVGHDDNGTLSFRIALSNRTGLAAGDTAVVFINVDERRDTGTPELFGTDVQLVLNDDGSFLMRRWDDATFTFALAPPSPTLTAGWSDGYRFSVGLTELGSPRHIEFAAGTRTTAGGVVAKDQLNGRYDTATGAGGPFDPSETPRPASNPPAAPLSLRASRTRSDGVRIEWRKSAGATKYEVWRSIKKGARSLRLGTTTRTSFLDKRAVRGVLYSYATRAGNAIGWSPFSQKVVGGRR